MSTLGAWLFDQAFHAHLPLVLLATIAWFVFIYAVIAGGA